MVDNLFPEGSPDELRQRAIAGWETFEGHTPHRPYIDSVVIACSNCGQPVTKRGPVPKSGNRFCQLPGCREAYDRQQYAVRRRITDARTATPGGSQ